MSLPSWSRYPGRYTIVFAAIALLLFVLENVNGRFWLNDFKVYYGAGEALLNGAPLYGVAHGLDSGIFKYAPALALFYALFALLPYGLAASIQYALIVLAFLDGSRRIDRLLREHLFNGQAPNYWPLFLTGLVCVVHLHRELHLGNINMQLLWLLVVGLEQLLVGRDRSGGAILGIAMLAKPHFVVLLPLLLLRQRTNVGAIALGTVVLGLILPAFALGFQGDIQVHRDWLATMAEHNASLIYTGGDDHRAVNTVYSFLHRSVLKHLVAPTAMEAFLILAAIATLFGSFVLWNKRRRADPSRSFAFEYLLLIAIVPSITLTDTEHFLLAMPMIAYLLQQVFDAGKPRWLMALAIPILFAYGGNWEDALGPLSDHMISRGVLGIGNTALVVLCTFLFIRSNPGVTIASNEHAR